MPKKEGELYKSLTLYGRRFDIYYGYYEDCDRENPLCDPLPVYPDFLKTPLFTEDGEPFVTVTQDACEHFSGAGGRTADSTCGDCLHLCTGDGWIGICAYGKDAYNK